MCNKRIHGLTLIELLIFIVIIGIAANAMLGVFSRLTQSSAGLLPDKQAQAIASSMMNEILAQPFPSGDNVMGPEGIEARNGAPPYDSVNDYDNPAPIPVVALPNQPPATGVTPIPSLAGYSYQVTVAPTALPNMMALNDALLVTVSVTAPNGTMARLDGVRVRYAP